MSRFPIYIYDVQQNVGLKKSARDLGDILTDNNFLVTSSPDRACVFLVFIEEDVIDKLVELPHWNGDGRNHILWPMSGTDLSGGKNRALIIQPAFTKSPFRSDFDIVAPFHHEPMKGRLLGSIWDSTVDLLPLRRRYLVTFEGKWVGRSGDQSAIELLHRLKNRSTEEDSILIDHDCPNIDEFLEQYGLRDEEFFLCRYESERSNLLQESTFVLIVAPKSSHSSHHFQMRLYEALRYGAVPVIVGGDAKSMMPFSERLDWNRAALFLPLARLPELHFLLRTFSDEDLFARRRQGNLFWRNYLATPDLSLLAALHVVRERLGIPPPVIGETESDQG